MRINFENLWIGTEGGGVNFMPNKNQDNYAEGFYHFNINETGSGENFSYAFSEEILSKDLSSIWIGVGVPTALATTYISAAGNPDEISLQGVEEMTNGAFAIVPDGKGGIWVGSYGEGLFKFSIDQQDGIQLDLHHQHDKDNPSSISSNIIRSICFDSDSNLWVGTSNGLNKLLATEQGQEEPSFIVYKHDITVQGSISHDYIMPIFLSSSNDLWIGTMGGGLNKLKKGDQNDNDTFEVITVSDGLPNNTIKGILEDDHQNLWISSNRGLSKYNANERTITNYDINDGLQDNEFSEMACLRRNNGEMIFGGVNGFNVFNPDDIEEDTSDTKIVFTELQVLNNVVDIGEKINGRELLTKSISETEEVKTKVFRKKFHNRIRRTALWSTSKKSV